MYCANCGTRLDDGSAFCPKCGVQIAAGSGGAQTTAPPQAPSARQPAADRPRGEPEPSAWSWFTGVLTRKYASFEGRARRKEYWSFTLFFALIWLGLMVVDAATGSFDEHLGVGILSALWAVGCMVPSLAAGVRRLHDTGRTGWWMLVSVIPLIGPIVLLVFCALDGQPGPNQYGPNPKGI